MFSISLSLPSGMYIIKGFLLYITSKIIEEKSDITKFILARHSEILGSSIKYKYLFFLNLFLYLFNL